MCLAVPMELVEIKGDGTAVAELEGARYDVNLNLIGEAALGEYVIVHAGYAIERLDREEAETRLGLFAQMAQAQREGGDGA